jgi:hypothetical protein
MSGGGGGGGGNGNNNNNNNGGPSTVLVTSSAVAATAASSLSANVMRSIQMQPSPAQNMSLSHGILTPSVYVWHRAQSWFKVLVGGDVSGNVILDDVYRHTIGTLGLQRDGASKLPAANAAYVLVSEAMVLLLMAHRSNNVNWSDATDTHIVHADNAVQSLRVVTAPVNQRALEHNLDATDPTDPFAATVAATLTSGGGRGGRGRGGRGGGKGGGKGGGQGNGRGGRGATTGSN